MLMVRCSTTSQVTMAATVAFQFSVTSKQTSARSKQPLCIFPESDYAAFQPEMLLFPVLSEASDASPLALWFNANASWLICYFSKLGGLKILLGRLGGPMLNNCAAGGEENVVLHPQVWPGVSAPTSCLPPSVATGCTSVRIMAFLEQVNGPLTPHQSLAWLIRQRNQSPPLPSPPLHRRSPIQMVSAQSREWRESKVSFRGSAQQFSPAALMTRLEASCSWRGATPGEHAREETLAAERYFYSSANRRELKLQTPPLSIFLTSQTDTNPLGNVPESPWWWLAGDHRMWWCPDSFSHHLLQTDLIVFQIWWIHFLFFQHKLLPCGESWNAANLITIWSGC